MWRNRNLHIFLERKENVAATLENILVGSQRVKHKTTVQPSHFTHRYVNKRNGNMKTCIGTFIIP